jgi:hypothetical protein
MTKSTNPSALEDAYSTLRSLELSSEETLLFIGVEPSETEGESRLMATIQGNRSKIATAIYQAMISDTDLAEIIQTATFEFFKDYQETTDKD